MGLAVEGAALSVVAFTLRSPPAWIIFTGRHSAPARRPGNSVYWLCGFAGWRQRGRARGSLESLARFIRNNPGAEGF